MNVAINEIGDGRFQVSYIDYQTQKKRRKFFKSIREAKRYRAEVLHTSSNGELTDGRRFVGHLMKMYLMRHPDSLVTQRRNSFISFCDTFNRFEIEQVNVDVLRGWFQKLKDDNGYSNKTLLCIKILINNFFKWLVVEKIIASNPLLNIQFKVSKCLKRPRVVLAEEEVRLMLELMKEHCPQIILPYIYTLVHTGARKNEIRKLKWPSVDFNTGFLELRKTKNQTDRLVMMSQPLKEMLQSLPRQSEWVFVNKKGGLLSASQIDEQIEIFQRKYPEQKRWRCHSLRHSFAYNFLKMGGKMYQLQRILGHKSIQMTVDLYGNLNASDIDNPSPYSF